jgi:diguanylate cyclase (GGDEF)-like protein
MDNLPVLVLEAINAIIALLLLLLGFRVVRMMRFTLQKRSMILLAAAAVLFAAQEALAFAEKFLRFPENAAIGHEAIESAFILCMAAAMLLIIRSERLEISVLRKSVELDSLTQVYNLSYFQRAAARRIDQAKRYHLPLALAMLDVDDFKLYNDTFGHAAGNLALQAMAKSLQETVRLDDLLARYGGEEFVVLMINPPKTARIAAERIRFTIESVCSPQRNSLFEKQVTISIGLATLSPTTQSLGELIEAADQALYSAKKAGKNRVSAAGSASPPARRAS